MRIDFSNVGTRWRLIANDEIEHVITGFTFNPEEETEMIHYRQTDIKKAIFKMPMNEFYASHVLVSGNW